MLEEVIIEGDVCINNCFARCEELKEVRISYKCKFESDSFPAHTKIIYK